MPEGNFLCEIIMAYAVTSCDQTIIIMMSHYMHNEFVFVSQSIAKKMTLVQKDCTIWETRKIRERSGIFLTKWSQHWQKYQKSTIMCTFMHHFNSFVYHKTKTHEWPWLCSKRTPVLRWCTDVLSGGHTCMHIGQFTQFN